jgi:DNA-binding transcriptional ArsR family regulator
MPDDYEFRKHKKFEDYEESLEANRYIHDAYLKAINHPVRRKILKLILQAEDPLSEDEIFRELKEQDLITERENLTYNLDYLLKAFCIEKIEQEEQITYTLTQSGKIIEYLKRV